jgi:guanylate kinase
VWSVSATTRSPRAGEVDGRDYHFISPPDFDRLIQADAFLEWADVYDHRYGTLERPIDIARAEGRPVLLELDVQGALAVKARIPDAVLVFLVPRDEAQLEERLRARGTEDEPALQRRLAAAREEMAQAGRFDHVVENDVLDRAVDDVAAILEAVSAPEE